MLYFIATFILIFSLISMHSLIGVLALNRITIPGAFYLTYIFMIYIPAFYVYDDYVGAARNIYILSVISVLITVPLGIFLINYLYKFKRIEIKNYFTSPPVVDSTFNIYPTIFLIIIVSVFFTLFYFSKIPTIPIFDLIKGSDVATLTQSREDSFKLLDPRWGGTYFFYIFLFLRTLVFPILITVTLGFYLYTKKKKWLYLFLLVLLVGSFYAISQLSRAPIAAIIMRMSIFLLLFYRGNINFKYALVGLIMILSYPLIITMSYVEDRTFYEGLEALVFRMTYTPAEDLYYYFEIFPSVHDYLHGQTLIKPILKLFDFNYFYIENYVARYISPGGLVSAHANAAFLSNLNADFGLLGVFLGTPIIAMFIQGIQIHLLRNQKNIYNMSIFAFLLYAIWVLNFGSITSVLFVNGLLPIFIFMWGIKLVTSFFNLISVNISEKNQ
jgi:oligosaccharide repeat unit polymerase